MQRSLLKSGYQLTKILTKLKERPDQVLILTHDYPDPDALASAYSLALLLEKGFQIPSRIVYGGVIGRVENRAMVRLLKIPAHKLKPTDLKKYKDIALVDTQPDFKNNSFPKNRKAFLVVDQHPPTRLRRYGVASQHAIIDIDCGATCVVLAEALLLLEIEIPALVATALAYGILTDTLNLYRVKRNDVIQTYLAILPKADMRLLAKIQNPPRTTHFFETLSNGIRRARVRKGLIVSHLGFVQSPDFVSQVADLLLTYQGIRFSFCSGRCKGKFHVSLRLKEGMSEASEVLRDIFPNKGQAGGHNSIAGGSFKVGLREKEERWVEIEKDLTQKLLRRLKISPKEGFSSPFHDGI